METIQKVAQQVVFHSPKRGLILQKIQNILPLVNDQLLQEYLKKWLIDTYYIRHEKYNNQLEFQAISQHYMNILPDILSKSTFLQNFFKNPYTYYELLHINQIIGFSLLLRLHREVSSEQPIYLQSCNIKIHTEKAYNNAFTNQILEQTQQLYNEIASQEGNDEEHAEERIILQHGINKHYVLQSSSSQVLNEMMQFNDLRIKIPRESNPHFYDDKFLYRTIDNKIVYQPDVYFADYDKIESLYVANITEENFKQFKLELLSQDIVKHFSTNKACVKITLQNLVNITSLTLRYTNIDQDTFISILQVRKHLKELNLFGNNICFNQELESNILSQDYQKYILNSLTYLNLGENNIQTIEFINKLFPNLQHLELQCINLKQDCDQQISLKSLQFLNMADNKLYTLKPLKQCVDLIYIDYSYNNIADIHYIADIKCLKYAYFSHNNVEFLHNFKNLTELLEIDISYNKLHDTHELLEIQHLPNLMYLNYNYCNVNYNCPGLKFVNSNVIIQHEELLEVDDENQPIDCDPVSVQSSQVLTMQ